MKQLTTALLLTYSLQLCAAQKWPLTPNITHAKWQKCDTIQKAALLDHAECITKLLSQKVGRPDVNAADENGMTALHWAVMTGHNESVKALLKSNDISVNRTDNEELTALHYAALRGREACIVALLTHPKINVYATNPDGITPQALADNKGHAACITLLENHAPLLNGPAPKTIPKHEWSNEQKAVCAGFGALMFTMGSALGHVVTKTPTTDSALRNSNQKTDDLASLQENMHNTIDTLHNNNDGHSEEESLIAKAEADEIKSGTAEGQSSSCTSRSEHTTTQE